MQILLEIDERSKHIPYKPANHADSQNHGFRVLKGKIDKCSKIFEAKDTPEFVSILETINHIDSPFFSVGCEKSHNKSESGYWSKGYIEFAFNYEKLVSDATQYFPLFFHFNRFATEFIKANDVQFLWSLQAAEFKAVPCKGFSCCTWITTGEFQSSSEARAVWGAAVDLLKNHLSNKGKPQGLGQIYGQ